MDEKIIDLVKKYREQLNSLLELSNNYNSLISLFEKSLNDLEQIDSISLDKITFVKDETKNDIENAITAINNIKSLSILGFDYDEAEIKENIQKIITKLKEEQNNNEELKKYNNKVIELQKIIEIKESNFAEDLDTMFNFLYASYKDNLISIEEYIKLNSYITLKHMESKKLANDSKIEDETSIPAKENKTKIHQELDDDDSQMEEIIITNNIDEDIIKLQEKLPILFSNKGYDYETLLAKTKQDIEKFVKNENNIVQVLTFLSNHGISQYELMTHQKVISKIFIYYEPNAIEEINKFLEKNQKTKLTTLLTMGSIFFSRKRKYTIKDNKNEQPSPPKSSDTPEGSLEDFATNVSLYKKFVGYEEEYKMTDDDFRRRIEFFTTSTKVIERNLNILKEYNLVLQDEKTGRLLNTISPQKNEFLTSSLLGRNTEYIMDRCIEANLYEYVLKYKSILMRPDFPLIWYKIKRANSIKEEIYAPGGKIIGKFKKDSEEYNGIKRVTNEKGNQIGIVQENMTMKDLLKGERYFKNITIPDPDEYAQKEFQYFYKYNIYKPKDIVEKFKKQDKISNEKIKSIHDILEDYYLRNKEITNEVIDDEIIKSLENIGTKTITMTTKFTIKNQELETKTAITRSDNGLAYQITIENSNWPKVELTISRLKVLKICSLLKQNNLWIKDNSNEEEIAALILISLTKDTILSEAELEALKQMSITIAKKISHDRENNKGVRR